MKRDAYYVGFLYKILSWYRDTGDSSSVNLQNFCWMTGMTAVRGFICHFLVVQKYSEIYIMTSLPDAYERSLPHMTEYCEVSCMCRNLCSLPDRFVFCDKLHAWSCSHDVSGPTLDGRRISWLRFFSTIPNSFTQVPGHNFGLEHDHFLRHLFQFTIRCYPNIRQYILSY